MATATPHDTLFHLTFQHPRHAAGWLRSVLPKELVAAIDWASLRAAPEKVHGDALRLQVTDILFEVALQPHGHALFVVPEHKSWLDPEAHGQLLGYCLHVAQRTRTASSPPALVVPVLLCHGKAAWPETWPPHPHFDGLDPAAAAALAALQPLLRFLVDDLMRCSEAQLRHPGLTSLAQLTRLCLRFLRGSSAAEALAAIDRWSDLLRDVDQDEGPPLGRETVAAIGWYCLHVAEIPAEDLHGAFERILQRPEETIMSTAERLKREGRAEGRTEGRAEGRAETILRQMNKRFGPLRPETIARVQMATQPELDCWTDRILDAKSLTEVFDA
ncbi:MAG TPA: Rpn family recombination-promoting nuclease/putative transposase [Planctomycetota bacterium]|nr:Rpn family recombination-promoting nuclease/putative transposase [Planctomycetota bacterium]